MACSGYLANSSVSSLEPKLTALFVLSATGGVSALVCLVAAVLSLASGLHKHLPYRLALYHVLAGFVSGTICACELLSVLYYGDPASPGVGCTALAFLMHYSMWMKLCFTGWVSFHLFCLASFNQNLKKLEILYVSTSLLLPAAVSAVPAATGSYGLAGAWCWIKSKNECSSEVYSEGVTEQLALWYGPAAGSLALDSVAVLTAVAVLTCRTYMEKVDRDRAVLVIRRPTQTSSLSQMLPLLAYTVTWCLLVIPSMVDRLYAATHSDPVPPGLVLANAFCIPGWSLAAGVTMVINVLLVLASRKSTALEKQRTRYGSIEEDFGDSVAIYSTDSVNWSSSFMSTTSCELANRNAGVR